MTAGLTTRSRSINIFPPIRFSLLLHPPLKSDQPPPTRSTKHQHHPGSCRYSGFWLPPTPAAKSRMHRKARSQRHKATICTADTRIAG
ncbi:hypothetical protein EX30DRAFT_670 [Ascodesmis nigricans]|uniref:Uncharacterized protein n=1 Tax=Ascodesmis nigricans TaxID=341454 RepID=A0A4S2N5B6_9PEZI|nr:hypothetical protein EX30DRAFT_670 [Ascodesmis nigricans]